MTVAAPVTANGSNDLVTVLSTTQTRNFLALLANELTDDLAVRSDMADKMTLTEIINKLRELHMRVGHEATVLVGDDEGEYEPKPVTNIEFDPDFKTIVINYDDNYHDPLA